MLAVPFAKVFWRGMCPQCDPGSRTAGLMSAFVAEWECLRSWNARHLIRCQSTRADWRFERPHPAYSIPAVTRIFALYRSGMGQFLDKGRRMIDIQADVAGKHIKVG